jgi:hypothetical protein
MRPGRVLIVIAVVAFCGYVFYSLEHVEPVTVTASRLERDGESIYVDGSLANNGSDQGPIELDIRYYDSNGRTVGQDTVRVDKLASGGRADFRSSERRLGGVSDFSIYLNHGKNPYGN